MPLVSQNIMLVSARLRRFLRPRIRSALWRLAVVRVVGGERFSDDALGGDARRSSGVRASPSRLAGCPGLRRGPSPPPWPRSWPPAPRHGTGPRQRLAGSAGCCGPRGSARRRNDTTSAPAPQRRVSGTPERCVGGTLERRAQRGPAAAPEQRPSGALNAAPDLSDCRCTRARAH